MNITLSTDGGYEGDVQFDHGTVPFCGTLELLKVLEDLVSSPARGEPRAGQEAQPGSREIVPGVGRRGPLAEETDVEHS